MRKGIVLALAIALMLMASFAHGGKKPGSQSAGLIIEVSKAVSEPVSVFCVPDGSGYAIASAFAYKGGVVDPVLTVTVKDEFRRPLAGVPCENILLGPTGVKNSFCGSTGAIAGSGSTNQDGVMLLDGTVKGSGNTSPTGDGLRVIVQYGTETGESDPIGLYMNSADINNDGVVDADDMDLFDRDMSFKYNYRSDFNWDGKVDAFDQIMLDAAMGKSCN